MFRQAALLLALTVLSTTGNSAGAADKAPILVADGSYGLPGQSGYSTSTTPLTAPPAPTQLNIGAGATGGVATPAQIWGGAQQVTAAQMQQAMQSANQSLSAETGATGGTSPSAGGGAGIGTASGFGSGTTAGQDAGFGSSPGIGAGGGFGSSPGIGTGTGFGSNSSIGTGTGFGSNSSIGTGTGFGSNSSIGTGAGFGSNSGFGTGTGSGSGADSGLGSSFATGNGPGAGATFAANAGGEAANGFGSDTGFPGSGSGSTLEGGGLGSSLGSGLEANSPLGGSAFGEDNSLGTMSSAAGGGNGTAGDGSPDATGLGGISASSITPGGTAKSPSAKDDTPIRRALSELRMGHYDACMTKLDQILQTAPGNGQAHYLKAIAYVNTRHYAQASEEYRAAIRCSPNSDLSRLAEAGLLKLTH